MPLQGAQGSMGLRRVGLEVVNLHIERAAPEAGRRHPSFNRQGPCRPSIRTAAFNELDPAKARSSLHLTRKVPLCVDLLNSPSRSR